MPDIQLIRPRTNLKPTGMTVDGELFTINDFPPPTTVRWVRRRKLVIAAAVISGLSTEDEILERYPCLTRVELRAWVEALSTRGIDGLRALRKRVHVVSVPENPSPVSAEKEAFPSSTEVEDDSPLFPTKVASVGEYTILSNGIVECGDQVIQCTGQGSLVLTELMMNPGKVVERDTLHNLLSNKRYSDTEPVEKLLDVVICQIRRRFREAFGVPFIETSWGRGYFVPVA